MQSSRTKKHDAESERHRVRDAKTLTSVEDMAELSDEVKDNVTMQYICDHRSEELIIYGPLCLPSLSD